MAGCYALIQSLPSSLFTYTNISSIQSGFLNFFPYIVYMCSISYRRMYMNRPCVTVLTDIFIACDKFGYLSVGKTDT